MLSREGALPAGLRLTASDRPGEAQPVPVRDIPQQPWGRIMGFVAVALAIGTAGLEANARRIGLRAGDLDNSEVAWVKERVRSDSAGPGRGCRCTPDPAPAGEALPLAGRHFCAIDTRASGSMMRGTRRITPWRKA